MHNSSQIEARVQWPTGELPERVRVLILGGGIHGVGLLHDLASRGWRDVHLVERNWLGSGTSSKSTKLIHGGLRYLQNPKDFGLVAEALRERRTLLQTAPDLVKPLELIFPVLKKGGVSRPVIKAGLTLYDLLAGRYGIEKHRWQDEQAIKTKAPVLDLEKFRAYYSFWDCQTDDLELVRRVAASARQLGANYTEHCEALSIVPTEDGWVVSVKTADGKVSTISALYVFNALGPWAHKLLTASRIPPTHRAINNRGSHALFGDIGLKSGLFLQSPEDGRIFFLLPWLGHTLLGTTEDLHHRDPDDCIAEGRDITYMLDHVNRYLKTPLTEKAIQTTFSGLRWLAVEEGRSLSKTSRNHVVGEHHGRRGLLMTLYGGKLSAYRSLCETIGDRICTHFGEFQESKTASPDQWAKGSGPREGTAISRFDTYTTVTAV